MGVGGGWVWEMELGVGGWGLGECGKVLPESRAPDPESRIRRRLYAFWASARRNSRPFTITSLELNFERHWGDWHCSCRCSTPRRGTVLMVCML